MSKGKICTLLVFCLSFAVVFGGWFFTKEMLNRKEAEILAERGQVSLGVSETDIKENNLAMQEIFEAEVLSEEKIAEILTVWEVGGREVPHDPMRGQMNMEQAIKAGKDWIAVMAEHGIVPEKLAICDFDKITAKLCTLEVQVDFEENLISYWFMKYTKDDVSIDLAIHAASGGIWKANIIMNDFKGGLNEYSPEELLKIAFPFIDAGNKETVNLINNTTCEIMPKGLVFAAVKESSTVVDEQEPIVEIKLWLNTV